MSLAPPPAAATPIFDEVDRWWRDGGDDPAPATMLSFPGSARAARRRVGAEPSEPRHGLAGTSSTSP